MATVPVLTYHDGKLNVPEALQREWNLVEGAELRVVSASSSTIHLEPAKRPKKSAEDVRALLDSIKGLPWRDWAPGEREEAEARKQRARQNLDRLYASGDASTTELRAAEREWELADDELDFGPLSRE